MAFFLRHAAKAVQGLFKASTAPLRVLPDFIIIGAQRGGTSSLYHYLRQHSFVAPASKKEIHFFDLNYHRGPNWYRAHFPSRPFMYYAAKTRRMDLLTGEATPFYLFHAPAAQRTATLVPKAKLIVLLRNPVNRAYSHYRYEVGKGREMLPFKEAIEREEERLREAKAVSGNGDDGSINHRRYAYLARGIYIDQLENWMRYFPREQMLAIKSEDYFRNPSGELRRVFGFLGIPDWDPPIGHHESESYEPMDRSTQQRLREYFEPHNQRLYRFLGRDLGWDGKSS